MDALSGDAARTAPIPDRRPAALLQNAASVAVLLATAGVLAVVVPRLGQLPEAAVRMQVAPLAAFALGAAAISASVLWRAGAYPGAPEVGLAMALYALATALAIVPWGQASPAHRTAFGVAWCLMFLQFLHFWTRFPQRMTPSATRALATRPGWGRWLDPHLRWTARVAHLAVWTWPGRVFLVIGGLAMSWAIVGERSMPYGLLTPQGPHDIGTREAVALLANFSALFVNVLVIGTSYRLADEVGRRKVLWIVLGHLLTTIFIFFEMAVSLALKATGSALLTALDTGLEAVYLPVCFTLFLGGYAQGVFQSGAFDIRPLIGRSTVYGASLMSLTFVFAGVEELAETFVVAAVGLPEGAGAWMGAGAVAGLFGPIHERMTRALKRATAGPPGSGAPVTEEVATAEATTSEEPVTP